MTSRNLLWSFLALAAVPLVLEATVGCSLLLAGSDEVPDPSNAYLCACECGAGARERTIPVAAGPDDAEEATDTGVVALGSSDLDISKDANGVVTLVAVRFVGIGVPQGAPIESAHVQFTADVSQPGASDCVIEIEDAVDASPFTTADGDLSGRPREPGLMVPWSIPEWTEGDAGVDQRTPDLTSLLQAVVDDPAWTEANALVLFFDGTGAQRAAVSFNADPTRAATLVVRYADPTESVVATLPVCLEAPVTRAEEAVDANGDGLPDTLQAHCGNTVENTLNGMVGACGLFTELAACECDVVATGTVDNNDPPTPDPDDDTEFFGYVSQACTPDDPADPVCEEEPLAFDVDGMCTNFDPVAYAACIEPLLVACGGPVGCNLSACDPFLSATNAAGDSPVCVALEGGSPRALAFQLFGRRSLCEVSGLAEIEVGEDGREPKKDPAVAGVLEILGGPCPDASCPVGLSYQLGMDAIEFDVRFAPDPRFVDLIQAGETLIGAADLGPAGAGELGAGTARAVSRGRRSGDRRAYAAGNPAPVALGIDWATRTCSLSGDVAGAVDAEEGVCAGDGATPCNQDAPDCDAPGGPCVLDEPDDQALMALLDLSGSLVNQPPTADAGDSRSVECTSPDGARFALDGTGSHDPDGAGDIRVASWTAGSRVGPSIGFDLAVESELGVGEAGDFVLRVVDAFAQADEDETTVLVVDTTPPDVFCNAPATIDPPSTPVEFTATATDVCDTSLDPELVDLECFKINGAGKRIDKTHSCRASLQSDTIRIRNSGGVGMHFVWTARATDDSGNTGSVDCEVEVVVPGS